VPAAPLAGLQRTVAHWWRRLAGRPGGQVSVVYDRRYRLDVTGLAQDPRRAEKVLSHLAGLGLLRAGEVAAASPVPFKALCRVHDLRYLETLGDAEALTRVLGVRLAERDRDRAIDIQRHMAGGTLLATELARGRGGVGYNLGGGLHHAFRDHGERFCLINDVASAIAEARAGGFGAPVLVVDLDLHDGDGTRNVFAADATVHTFSIHNGSSGTDPDAVASTSVELGAGVDDETLLAALHHHLPPVFEAVRPGLAFYVAGTDVAADDSLGDWKMTDGGVFARDLFVTRLLRGGPAPVPLVVVTGGGYGHETWRYTARYLAWLLGGEEVDPPRAEEAALERYRRLARLLRPAELTGEETGDEGWGLTEEDVLGPLGGMPVRRRFLGYYSRHGAELALERAGLLDRMRRLGFEEPHLELELDNPAGETVRVFGDREEREPLIELRARRDPHAVPGCEVLRIEWLLLQNPRAGFTAERPPLPGQRHPGLGLLEDTVALLVLVCDRLGLDGIYFVPSHYHLVAQSRRLLRFLEPRHEALFRELERVLGDLPLGAATRTVEEGRVWDAVASRPFALPPMPMVLPVSERLRGRLQAAAYEDAVAEAAAQHELELRGAPAG
jgi:acetoin utilization deacetylase AcuC-like enzyme